MRGVSHSITCTKIVGINPRIQNRNEPQRDANRDEHDVHGCERHKTSCHRANAHDHPTCAKGGIVLTQAANVSAETIAGGGRVVLVMVEECEGASDCASNGEGEDVHAANARDPGEHGPESPEGEHVESEVTQVVVRERGGDHCPPATIFEVLEASGGVLAEELGKLSVALVGCVLPDAEDGSVEADDGPDYSAG